MNDEAVFVKKFPRYEDTYCLGIEEKARSLKLFDEFARNGTSERGLGTWILNKVCKHLRQSRPRFSFSRVYRKRSRMGDASSRRSYSVQRIRHLH